MTNQDLANFIWQIAGLSFHNHSELNFEILKGDPDAIASHLQQYIDGFSENVRKIFERFEFKQAIERTPQCPDHCGGYGTE